MPAGLIHLALGIVLKGVLNAPSDRIWVRRLDVRFAGKTRPAIGKDSMCVFLSFVVDAAFP
jgi:hypothetical protein